ncbi:hypothetical protein BST81_25440 [Leptolyngbya sp. 'hensonii']|nr:hypothetical protein BST81_25440 [Leptolyngbya sp. 'hensonii']
MLLAAILVIGYLVIVIICEIQKQQKHRRYQHQRLIQPVKRPIVAPPAPPLRPPKAAPLPPQVFHFDSRPYREGKEISQLYRRLLTLTRDEKTAKRLFQSTSERNPGRSIEWVLEKTILDLERDRGRY